MQFKDILDHIAENGEGRISSEDLLKYLADHTGMTEAQLTTQALVLLLFAIVTADEGKKIGTYDPATNGFVEIDFSVDRATE